MTTANSATAAAPAADLNASLGLRRIVELEASGRARLEYTASPAMCHSGGVVQGGFVTGWIDAAMAHAAIAMAGSGPGPEIVQMTLEIKVSFFAPVRPGPVFAEAWVEKRGRKTCFFEGRLLDSAGKVLAKASSTILLADMGKVSAASAAATGA